MRLGPSLAPLWLPCADRIVERVLPVLPLVGLVLGKPGAHIVHGNFPRGHCYAQVPGIGQDVARAIDVAVERLVRRVGRIGTGLVDDAIEFLPGKEVIASPFDRGLPPEAGVWRTKSWPPASASASPLPGTCTTRWGNNSRASPFWQGPWRGRRPEAPAGGRRTRNACRLWRVKRCARCAGWRRASCRSMLEGMGWPTLSANSAGTCGRLRAPSAAASSGCRGSFTTGPRRTTCTRSPGRR
jgi:hypothetical protein